MPLDDAACLQAPSRLLRLTNNFAELVDRCIKSEETYSGLWSCNEQILADFEMWRDEGDDSGKEERETS